MAYVFDEPYWRDPHRVQADLAKLTEEIEEIERKGRTAHRLRAARDELAQFAWLARTYQETGRRQALPMYKFKDRRGSL